MHEARENGVVLGFMSDGVWIEDLESRTGTILDGQLVRGRISVRAGQRIHLGHFVLTYDNGEAAAQIAQVPAAPAPIAREVPKPAPQAAAETPPPAPRAPAREEPTRLQAALEVNRAIKRQIQQELVQRLDLKRLTTTPLAPYRAKIDAG